MASLTFKGKSFYAVFNHSVGKLWKRIGRVNKREAKKILKKLELEFEKDRLNLQDD